jgi:hypothetical protein
MAGPNALRPELMSDAERLDEAAEILARGIVRLRQRQEGQPTPLSCERGDIWLDFTASRRRHADTQLGGDHP